MVHLLSVTENLHLILRVLYDDMMALCAPLTTVASAIAGIGALLYIAYRVWQSLAQAEPLDTITPRSDRKCSSVSLRRPGTDRLTIYGTAAAGR